MLHSDEQNWKYIQIFILVQHLIPYFIHDIRIRLWNNFFKLNGKSVLIEIHYVDDQYNFNLIHQLQFTSQDKTYVSLIFDFPKHFNILYRNLYSILKYN